MFEPSERESRAFLVHGWHKRAGYSLVIDKSTAVASFSFLFLFFFSSLFYFAVHTTHYTPPTDHDNNPRVYPHG